MQSPGALRGAMGAGAMASTQRATSSVEAGSAMELSKREARVIFWRNMALLLLSLVVGSKTLWAILRWVDCFGRSMEVEWSHTYHTLTAI